MKINKCSVIGVLDNGMSGLTVSAQQIIQQAEVIIAARRTMLLFQSEFKVSAECIDLSGKMLQLPDLITTALADGKKVLVLATGDPLCHGIGRFLVNKLGKDVIDILPNVSLIQLAFAHLGEAWQNAEICSVHSKDAGEWFNGADQSHGLYALLRAITEHELLAVYTSPDNTPQRIAHMLQLEKLADYYEISVFEQLLQTNEKISLQLTIAQVAAGDFSDPNVLLIKRKHSAPRPLLFGHSDDFYAQRKPEKGLITRRDVRAVVLAKMQLRDNSIVWDIGAGSGSVGLEAAALCQRGYVYAIEKNCPDLELIEANRNKMQLINYSVVCGKAPEKMADWPAPDAVFIGGSAGQLQPLLAMIVAKMQPQATLVMNFITLENLTQSIEIVKIMGLEWEVTQLQASHSKPILHMNRLQADNLVWIVSATKAG